MNKKNNLLLKSMIITTSILMMFQSNIHSVLAIGPSPAFEETKVDDSSKKDAIIRSVAKQLDTFLQLTNDVYKKTDIADKLHKNYADVGYPSVNKENKEGIDEDGEIDLNSIKKPITEPSKIELAEQVRYYQFFFTNGLKYQKIDPAQGDVKDFSEKEKLNFFDYVDLINSIKDNPSYSKAVKEKKLTEVENDLLGAIELLYYGNTDKSMSAMQGIKDVSLPFSYNKYSYLQLLAAYEKDPAINSTLSYYSEIIDTLNTIRLYSAGVRQGRDVQIKTAVLANNLNEKYNDVQEKLILPVAKVVNRNFQEQEDLKAGENFQKEQLKREFNIKEGS